MTSSVNKFKSFSTNKCLANAVMFLPRFVSLTVNFFHLFCDNIFQSCIFCRLCVKIKSSEVLIFKVAVMTMND